MNIAIDIRSLMTPHRTGVGEYTYGLLNALFDLDTANQYFLFYNSWKNVTTYIPKWKQENVHFISLRWPNKIFNASQFLFKKPLLDSLVQSYPLGGTERMWNRSIDVFFSPNIHFTALSSSTKRVLTVHDLSFELFPECYTRKQRLWHKFLNPKKQCLQADTILTPSENTKRDIQNIYGISPEKIQVLPLGISQNFSKTLLPEEQREVREKYGLPDKYILFLGTIEPRKNIEALLKAYTLFTKKSKKYAQYHLVIAGHSGWKSSQLLRSMSKHRTIQYLEYIFEEDKPCVYAGAKAFAYPSVYEGFGLPVLEAIACGIPVLTSSRSSLPEVAQHAAYYVNPYSVQEILTGLERMLFNTTIQSSLKENAFSFVKQHRWSSSAEMFLSLLRGM